MMPRGGQTDEPERPFAERADAFIAALADLIAEVRLISERLSRFEGDGLLIRTDEDTPIQTSARDG